MSELGFHTCACEHSRMQIGTTEEDAPLMDGDFCRCWHNKSLISFVKLQVLAMVKAQPIATVLSISQNDVSIPATIVPVPLVQLS